MTNTDKATLALLNLEVPGAFAYAAAAEARTHTSVFGTPVTCYACGNDRLTLTGRSLDLFNYDCAVCGAEVHSLTETGASA